MLNSTLVNLQVGKVGKLSEFSQARIYLSPDQASTSAPPPLDWTLILLPWRCAANSGGALRLIVVRVEDCL